MAQRDKKKIQAGLLEAADYVMLRAPALPIESYLALPQIFAQDDWAAAALSDPRVRSSLAIGSPSLLDALERSSQDDKKAPRLRHKLRRFLVRMSTRPTPYGMFAGAMAATWGEMTTVGLDKPARTRTRVDMDWLLRFVLTQESNPVIRKQLRWVANTACWHRHGRVILFERVPALVGGIPSRISLAAKPVVLRALILAKEPVLYEDLARCLAAEFPEAPPDRIERVLQQLWENSFLLTELLPPLTVEDPLAWVRDVLTKIIGGRAVCVQLDGLRASMAACDTAPGEQTPLLIKKAAAHAVALGATQTEMPLQMDLVFSSAECAISRAVAREAEHMAELLFRVSAFPNGLPNLASYRQAFLGRYGFEREVPMLELLDHEWGIGPLAQYGWGNGGLQGTQSHRRADTLQQLALAAIRNRELTVELTEELLAKMDAHPFAASQMPPSVDLNIFVLASSQAGIDAGDFKIMLGPNVGATTAGRNFGRFGHLLGDGVINFLQKMAETEEARYPRQIIAEVVSLPRVFRYANVVVRPAVRRYEVNYGVSPGVDQSFVIPMNELVVGVRDGRFYVRWVTRNLEVLFTAGHMLNSDQASRECHFLAEVSRDGVAQFSGFSWGPASGFPFLPRVQSGKSILQCAQWNLEPKSHGNVPLEHPGKFLEWFSYWCEYWRVPSMVYMCWADNRLLYDLSDPEQVEDLRGELVRRKGSGCLLQEALPSLEHAWLTSVDGGRRIVELVVPLKVHAPAVKDQKTPVLENRSAQPAIAARDRLRPPGSDWLFLKLYAPRSGENDLLAGPVRHLVSELTRQQLTQQWFFLRYADPEPHLRLRFAGDPERLQREVFPRICAWASELVNHGACQKFAFDTYDREIERYGGVEAMDTAEALFAADSKFMIELMASGPLPEQTLLAAVTIDDLLSGLGLDEDERTKWLQKTATAHKQVADEYRNRKKDLISILTAPRSNNPPIIELFTNHRIALSHIATQLAALEARGLLLQPLDKLYESFVHMHCNRLGMDPTREQRVISLLLRSRDAIAHLPAGTAPLEGSSPVDDKDPGSMDATDEFLVG
jgi:thiopeptide-type bacteriocin biosynthesis protein